jgi:hypothetical protein
VQGLGHELLAGSALAPDQDGEIGLGDLLDRLEDLPHRRTGADQLIEAVLALHLLTKQTDLTLEAMALERTRDDHADLVVVEGLGHVVVGAGLHRLDRDLLRAMGRDHHDPRLGSLLLRHA